MGEIVWHENIPNRNGREEERGTKWGRREKGKRRNRREDEKRFGI